MRRKYLIFALLPLLFSSSCQTKITYESLKKYDDYYYTEFDFVTDFSSLDSICVEETDYDFNNGADIVRQRHPSYTREYEFKYIEDVISSSKFYVAGVYYTGLKNTFISFYDSYKTLLFSIRPFGKVESFTVLDDLHGPKVSGYQAHVIIPSYNESFKKVVDKANKLLDEKIIRIGGLEFYMVFDDKEVYDHYQKLIDNVYRGN